MIGIGSTVRVKPPFDDALPGDRVIVSQNAETGAWQLQNDEGALTDFADDNLKEVI